MTRDLPCWGESGTSLLERAARLHYRAVWIHPFWNGNGRWARLLANIWLSSPLKKGDRHLTTAVFRGYFAYEFGASPLFQRAVRRHKTPLILWSEGSIGQESLIRNDYLKALEAADDGDFGPLLALHTQHVGQ